MMIRVSKDHLLSRRRLKVIVIIGLSMVLFRQQHSQYYLVKAQVISHELRKLAVASNQFGIDALRALDSIEPKDKVIVFSPICLTASLSMVMMGSSKYQVVSSLRHALYVWSMKPQEINRAYRDLFEHIGMNQPPAHQQQTMMMMMKLPKWTNQTGNSASSRSNSASRRLVNSQPTESIAWWQNDMMSDASLDGSQFLSLPKLVKLREAEQSWWRENSIINKEFRQQPVPEFSQMNSMSSIYIQRGLQMNYNYNLLLRDYYKTVVHPVDFIRNGEETRQHINSLVASSTEGKVKDLMKRQSSLDQQQNGNKHQLSIPKALIISTFHFRGTLDVQMKASKPISTPSSSSSSSSSSNNVQRERRRSGREAIAANQYIQTEPTLLKYGQFKRGGLDSTCIEIPFSNRLLSLIILMPNHANSTELLLTKLSAQVLSDMLNSMTVRQISLEIPVIKFGRGPTNVTGLLKELSLDDTFFGGFNGASTSTETGLNRWLRAEDIVHETSIDIGTLVVSPQQQQIPLGADQTEDRLKVGAHNETLAKRRGSKRDKTQEVERLRLDKPFFYFIADSINGLMLTMGRIRQ